MASAELKAQIQKQIESSHVLVYCKTTCPFCTRVKKLLNVQCIDYTSVELDLLDNTSEYQDALQELTGRRTVPNIFINGKSVGGCDDVIALHSSGKLARLILEDQQARDNGIGDRHNDNIMVTKSGNLFHIDLGHFLGNTKYFMGMNRERAPFVFTPNFEYVMGKRNSEMFKRFEDTAVQAYMIIRKNANVIINLFFIMKCTGIPELKSVEDLEYLRSVLVLDKPDQVAREHFKLQIQKCLKLQWSTQFNWFTHNIVHR